MRNDTPKNTANDGSLRRLKALIKGISPEASALGGVCGRKKEYTPRTSDRIAANSIGRLLTSWPGLMKNQSDMPATIQPMVPSTRISGKFSEAGTLAKITALESDRVGE